MRRQLSLLSITLILICGACTCPQKYQPQLYPPALPPCRLVPQPVRIALVLGSGGARGLAHVGVLEELENANIPLDLIIGCSAGSIVGALYADEPRACRLKSLLPMMRSNYLMDISIFKARFGLCQGNSLRKFLSHNLRSETFDDLKIPFYCVATDLCNGELVPIGSGPIVPAIEASCSIPFFFVPVELYGRVFVDGGVIDPIPVRIARHFSPEIIIAVDLQALLPRTFPRNLFGVAQRSAEIAFFWQTDACLKGADVIIEPCLGNIGTFDCKYTEFIYEAGREAARIAIPKILELMQKKGITTHPCQSMEQNGHIQETLFDIPHLEVYEGEPVVGTLHPQPE